MARAKKAAATNMDPEMGMPALERLNAAVVGDGPAAVTIAVMDALADDEPVLDSQSRGEDPAEPDVPPIGGDKPRWYEVEVRKNERAEWLVSSRGTISRAEDARDMLRVPQSFDLQQAEWVRADYQRAGYETRLIRFTQGEGGIAREVVED